MGADLYIISMCERLQAEHGQTWKKAIAERDRVAALHPEKHCSDPDCHPDLKAAQDAVWAVSDAMHLAEVYFRDPYNRWSLCAQLGLDFDSYTDADGFIQPAQAQRLKDDALAAQIGNDYRETPMVALTSQLMGTISRLTGLEVSPGPKPDGMSPDDLQYFVVRKAALLVFLESAIALDEPIKASL